jgi:hypothetical protein
MLKMLTNPTFLYDKKEAVFGLMRAGEYFKLLTKNSSGLIVPYEIHLRVDIEARTIYWRSVPRLNPLGLGSFSPLDPKGAGPIDLKEQDIVGTFLLEDVANLNLGIRLPEFKSVLSGTPSSHFFSLMGTKPEFTLDLVCYRRDQAVDWLFGLNTLLLAKKTIAVRPPSQVPPEVLAGLDSPHADERYEALKNALNHLGILPGDCDILFTNHIDLKHAQHLTETGWAGLDIDATRRHFIKQKLDYLSSLQSVPEPHIKRTPNVVPPPLYISSQNELDEEE